MQFNEHDAASEKSSFELMSNTLLTYGIELDDGHSLDDDLTYEEINYEEARLRGEYEPIYAEHMATNIEFKKEVKACETKEDLEKLLEEESALLYIQQFQKKIKAEPYRETVAEPKGELVIKEKYAVQARTSPSVEERIRHHEKAVVLNIYNRAKKLIEIDTKYTTQQLVTKINGFWETEHVKKAQLKDVLKQFCRFTMIDKGGQLMKNYKADKIKYWIVTSFALFDEEISYPPRLFEIKPTLI